MYTLLVCADLYGEKMNLELTFPTMPTLAELQRKITETYNNEASLRRPQGYPAVEFTIARLQIYDDVMLKWADLVAITQLHEYDQLYAFQPQSPWHIDVQKDLPPPRPPTQSRGVPAGGATPGGYDTSFSAVNASSGGIQATPVQQSYAAPAAAYGGASASAASRPLGGSPQTISRLEEQRRREASLQAELVRMKEETARLEHLAAQEAEEERRREAENTERLLRQKQEEYQRQRENMLRVEDEIRRLDEEVRLRQQNVSRQLPQQMYR
jgi:hypothetical protein